MSREKLESTTSRVQALLRKRLFRNNHVPAVHGYEKELRQVELCYKLLLQSPVDIIRILNLVFNMWLINFFIFSCETCSLWSEFFPNCMCVWMYECVCAFNHKYRTFLSSTISYFSHSLVILKVYVLRVCSVLYIHHIALIYFQPAAIIDSFVFMRSGVILGLIIYCY